MKEDQLEPTILSLGWIIDEDELNDAFANYILEDRVVQWIFSFDKIRGQQKIGGMLSLSTDKFSDACSIIFGEDKSYYPLVRSLKNIDVRAENLTVNNVKEASDSALIWAQCQNLENALKEYSLLPTSAPGARPIWHLAALAILGDVEKLQTYHDGFRNGEHLGFAPYIGMEHINRALAISSCEAFRM